MVLKRFVWILGAALVLQSCSGEATLEDNTASEELPKTENTAGQGLYTENCAQCHGNDGKLGASGASDLSASTLDDAELNKVITKGRNAMPRMGPILGKKKSINAVVDYVKELRK
jgi:mono/diheme cytochrome c family protein